MPIQPWTRATSVREAHKAMQAAGYGEHWAVRDGRVWSAPMGRSWDPRELRVDGIARFEGATDPADQTMVLALVDPISGRRGVVVSAYGPAVAATEASALAELGTGTAGDDRPPRTRDA